MYRSSLFVVHFLRLLGGRGWGADSAVILMIGYQCKLKSLQSL